MLTEGEIRQYLERIDYRGERTATLETLRGLVRAHLLHVPYENLDLIRSVPVSLKPDRLFDKIVLRHRGGCCFELQGLFRELLIALGFEVHQYAGRYMDEPGVMQMRRHRVLVVIVRGKRYLVDVGVRTEMARVPVELHVGWVQSDGIGEYRLRRDSFYGWVLMQKLPHRSWRDIYGFTQEPQIDADYVMPLFYCERHPDSAFNKILLASIFREDGVLMMEGDVLKWFSDGAVRQRHTIDEREVGDILRERYGMELTGPCPVRSRQQESVGMPGGERTSKRTE